MSQIWLMLATRWRCKHGKFISLKRQDRFLRNSIGIMPSLSWGHILKVNRTGQSGRGLLQDKQQKCISGQVICWEPWNLHGMYRRVHRPCLPNVSTRGRYNVCKRILACNFHILNHIFTNCTYTCSLNRVASSDIGHAPSHCIFIFGSHWTSKTYFFELLLVFQLHLHQTLHIQSPDLRDQKLWKAFCYFKKCAS